VTGSIKREICTELLRNLSEKLGAKFPSTTLGNSVVRISRLDDAFAGRLNWKPVEAQSLHQRDKKSRKKEKQKKK